MEVILKIEKNCLLRNAYVLDSLRNAYVLHMYELCCLRNAYVLHTYELCCLRNTYVLNTYELCCLRNTYVCQCTQMSIGTVIVQTAYVINTYVIPSLRQQITRCTSFQPIVFMDNFFLLEEFNFITGLEDTPSWYHRHRRRTIGFIQVQQLLVSVVISHWKKHFIFLWQVYILKVVLLWANSGWLEFRNMNKIKHHKLNIKVSAFNHKY